jgi:hypothetical protein
MPSPGDHENGAERVAFLLRVSSEEQRERETFEIQREFLQGYCRLYDLEVGAFIDHCQSFDCCLMIICGKAGTHR